MSNDFYRHFEDRYRGARATIKERLGSYRQFVMPLEQLGLRTAIDLGCGRGEWLELLAEMGFSAHGVDLNEAMLADCRERGLKVEVADALLALQHMADDSVALVTAFHLVEHLPFDVVGALVREAMRVLVPGGLLIVETPNPENLTVGAASFYLDPSHIRPVPHALLDFLIEYVGFGRHVVVRLQEDPQLHSAAPIGLINVLEGVSPDYSVVAQKSGNGGADDALAAAFARSYGLSLSQLGQRFEAQSAARDADLHGHIARLGEQSAQLSQAVGTQMAAMAARTEDVARDLSQLLAEQALALEAARQSTDLRLAQMAQQIAIASEARARAETERAVAEAERARAETERAKSELELLRRDERIKALEQRRGLIERRVAPADAATLVADPAVLAAKLHAAEQAAARLAEAHERERLVLHGHIGAIEQRVAELLDSRSWRVTAPMRVFGSGLRTLRTAPPPLPVLAAPGAGTLRTIGQAILRRPRLKRAAVALLMRAPRLSARLRGFMYQAPVTTAAPLPPLQPGAADLSPRAARAYASLQQARAAQAEERH